MSILPQSDIQRHAERCAIPLERLGSFADTRHGFEDGHVGLTTDRPLPVSVRSSNNPPSHKDDMISSPDLLQVPTTSRSLTLWRKYYHYIRRGTISSNHGKGHPGRAPRKQQGPPGKI